MAEVPRCRRKDCGRLFAVSPFIQRLARTFADYTEGIRVYWKHRSSSGTLEGLNHQIKTMLRQTCGRRGEGCYMLRLHALHQAHDKFIG